MQVETALVAAHRLEDGNTLRQETRIAAEAPVALVYNGLPHVVMMATPADLEDFALGFSLSEGIIAAPDELLECTIAEGPAGVEARLAIPFARFMALGQRQRHLVGRTGCGVCGVASPEQLMRPLPRLPAGPLVMPAAIHRALQVLPEAQRINRATGATHAAAWAALDGTLVLVREDVGRHNALDKLIGAMARHGIDPGAGFALITSRCSFEMAQKAATVGIRILVAISAPTTMALTVARQTGMSLVAFARSDRLTIYADGGRIAEVSG
jgi:formate dehydrogenase accessory protein FdhD